MPHGVKFLGLAAASCAAAMLSLPVARGQGQIVQTLDAFYSPSAAACAADGKTVFIANAARGDYGMFAGRGAISRASVGNDGTLTVNAARFIEGLNAPLGIAILPAAAGPFPAGALVVSVGGSFTVDASERSLADDEKRGTGLQFFDAASGKELGRIFLGRGSPAQELLGHPVADPTAVAADPAGNVYLADVGGSETRPLAQVEVRPGVIKITPAALEALSKRETPPKGSIAFALVTQIPAGLVYSARDNALYWGTSSSSNDAGAIFRLPGGDFAGSALETVARDLNSISNIGLTPNGSIIAGRNEGDIVAWRSRGKARRIRFRDDPQFLLPGQPATTTLGDGRVLVIMPELSGGGRGPWHQRVQIFTLPADF